MTEELQSTAGTLWEPAGIFEVVSTVRVEASPVATFAVARSNTQRRALRIQRKAAEDLLYRLLSASFPDRKGGWRLERTSRGAPRLFARSGRGSGLCASLSHCPGWVAVGWSTEAAVGLDIEVPRQGRDTAALAGYLGWQAGVTAPEAFHRRWVLWEAYIKCREGRLLQTADPEFERICRSSAEAVTDTWHGFPLPLVPGVYAAAVLRSASPRRLALRRRQPEMQQSPL